VIPPLDLRTRTKGASGVAAARPLGWMAIHRL